MEPDDQDVPAFDEVRRRARMVEHQLEARGIADARVLDAMRRVPREQFVAVSLRRDAYADAPLPIGNGQTISQPYIVALMTESARVGPSDRVLEVGAGSGYASAVLSLLAAGVYAIERNADLCDAARRRLERLGHCNVKLRCGDGSVGWPEAAPFDAILVAAGGPAIPVALREQLADGGRLVMPVGDTPHHQELVKVTRHGAAYRQETLCSVSFVPLIGARGWPT
jgi:protein-L-isoaspartate(D-aspartate) O-methyltransferase